MKNTGIPGTRFARFARDSGVLHDYGFISYDRYRLQLKHIAIASS